MVATKQLERDDDGEWKRIKEAIYDALIVVNGELCWLC